MTDVRQARRDLGARLRDLRTAANLRGYQLAELAGWSASKVSRIESGAHSLTEADLQQWCRLTGAELAYPDLRATLRNVNAAWMEWRRIVGAGHARHQGEIGDLEARTSLIRSYDPQVIHGLLQTPDYARAILGAAADFLHISQDLEVAVAARMKRQAVLRQGRHRFYFLIGEPALYGRVGSADIMREQLAQLSKVVAFPNVMLAIVPLQAEFFYRTMEFAIYDQTTVLIETVTAESTVTQPREIELYERTFARLAAQAVGGDSARALIRKAMQSSTL
ncbi:XRE family transcriptional regulator [Nocardia yunnanensis]|uniref:XRE family transcriptional regulator n=1 Tax=Nocardia yunnanensis TaxID=2382165 RepID=A0A386ZCG4_9NOCA|nr:helix-turn-helix transcriptional regulator [Nocardia yunnanensis]AYF74189.1 XRE family transcriptional regulator [Nocardia yunnanensis]